MNNLLEEQPLLVMPSLAKLIGLNEAIVLQQLHYWLKKSKHVIDDVPWVYNTLAEWNEQFPFLSKNTVQRTLDSLKKMGLVEATDKLNKKLSDRTLWYTICYQGVTNLGSPEYQTGVLLEVPKLVSSSITENTIPETTTTLSPTATASILSAYLECLGYKPSNYAPEGAAAKRLGDAGYSPADVVFAYNTLKAQPFWASKHLSLATVLKELPALAQFVKNGGQPQDVGKRQSKADAGKAAGDRVRQMLMSQDKEDLL